MGTEYTVSWVMDIEADSPREAAEAAWKSMREPDSIANSFRVCDPEGVVTDIDLGDAHDAPV